jgi:uncharacterized membrane protein
MDPIGDAPGARSSTTDLVPAVAVIIGALATFTLLLLGGSLIALIRSGRSNGGLVAAHPLATMCVLVVASALLTATTFGLARRRIWAWWATAAVLMHGIALLLISAVSLSRGNDRTDSGGMAATGAVACALLLSGVLIALVAPSTRAGFREGDEG